jgi:hypothetical protein
VIIQPVRIIPIRVRGIGVRPVGIPAQRDADVVDEGFQPDELSGLVSWHEADAIAGGDGTHVTTWIDSSGNGFDATEEDVNANGATLKTNILGGKPVVRFAIADRANLINNSYTDFAAIWTVFTVAAYVGASASMAIMDVSEFDTTNTGFAFFNDSGSDFWRCSASQVVPAGDQRDAGFKRRTGIQRAANIQFYRDGVSVGTAATGGNNALTQLTIGALAGGTTGYSMFGDIAEVIIYDRDLNDTEREQVEDYLIDKYGF